MDIVVRTKLRLPVGHPKIKELKSLCTVPNKTYAYLKSQGKWTGNTEREFTYYFAKEGAYYFPRGTANTFRVDEVKRDFTEGTAKFIKKNKLPLRKEQEDAVNLFLDKIDDVPGSCGLIEGPCGSGKTIVGAELIRRLGLRTLILVDQDNLVNQWKTSCLRVMGLDEDEIFIRQEGKRPPAGTLVDIYTIQSLLPERSPLEPHEREKYGLVIVDECHIVPAQATSKVVSSFRSRYLVGLTATPYRIDGLTPIITLFLGEILSKISTNQIKPEVRLTKIPKLMATSEDVIELVESAMLKKQDFKSICALLKPKILTHPEGEKLYDNIARYLRGVFDRFSASSFSDFVSQQFMACSWWGTKADEDSDELTGIIGTLCKSPERNKAILENLIKDYSAGRHVMVLSPRKKHLAILKSLLDEKGIPATVYTGDITSKKTRNAILENARIGKINILLATFNLTKKGLDIPIMDTIHLTHPFKIKSLTEGGDLEQAIGRILRPKTAPLSPAAVVYDYIDSGGGPEVLGWRHYKYYKAQGWDIKWMKE